MTRPSERGFLPTPQVNHESCPYRDGFRLGAGMTDRKHEGRFCGEASGWASPRSLAGPRDDIGLGAVSSGRTYVPVRVRGLGPCYTQASPDEPALASLSHD